MVSGEWFDDHPRAIGGDGFADMARGADGIAHVVQARFFGGQAPPTAASC